jgi:hypothetical protein
MSDEKNKKSSYVRSDLSDTIEFEGVRMRVSIYRRLPDTKWKVSLSDCRGDGGDAYFNDEFATEQEAYDFAWDVISQDGYSIFETGSD